MEPCENFRLHNFPDLSDACLPSLTQKGGEPDCFQRVDFETIGPRGRDKIAEARQAELARVEQEAYAKGFQDGEKAGMAAEVGKVNPVICNFSQALRELDNVRRELFLSAETNTIELALAIARKIVGQEISVNRDALLRIVRQAIEKVVDRADIRVRVNPADLAFVRESRVQLADLVDNLDQITVVADENVTFGGCLVETRMGDVDARLEKQLQYIDELFRAEMKRTRTGD